MKTCFIVSTGRTGTAFFTYFFNHVTDSTWSTHEPQPAFKRRGFELVSRAPTLYEQWYFKLPRLWRHARKSKDWYVETNYHLFSGLQLIRKAFPDALTVQIVRDGRDVVRSWFNRGRYLNDPDSRLTPEHVGDGSAMKKWDEWNALQKIAWNWKTVNRVTKRQNPDLTIHFEETFNPPHRDFDVLLERLNGVQVPDEEIEQAFERKVNESSHDLIPPYERWPDIWKDQFWAIAADAMDEFGYPAS